MVRYCKAVSVFEAAFIISYFIIFNPFIITGNLSDIVLSLQ